LVARDPLEPGYPAGADAAPGVSLAQDLEAVFVPLVFRVFSATCDLVLDRRNHNEMRAHSDRKSCALRARAQYLSPFESGRARPREHGKLLGQVLRIFTDTVHWYRKRRVARGLPPGETGAVTAIQGAPVGAVSGLRPPLA
jgi:hypothetical protein